MSSVSAHPEITWQQVLSWRLRRSLLAPVQQVEAAEIVRRLCGVQAQVPSSAGLAIGVRQAEPVVGSMTKALADGTLMRTWSMRGTLHLLVPDEAGAYLSLMAAGKTWEKPSWIRVAGVTPDEMAELVQAIAEVLDDQILTRDQLVIEVAARLGHSELDAKLRSGWGSLLKPAAWQGALCHGPPDGNRVTFARPDRILPTWKGVPDPDEAAKVVVPAYLSAYGPATMERFDNWLTRGGSRKGLLRGWFASVDERLATVDVAGTTAYLLAEDVDELAATNPSTDVHLLPGFDQYVLGPGTSAAEIVPPEHRSKVSKAAGWIAPVVVFRGRVIGVWDGDKTDVDVTFFGDDRPSAKSLDAAIDRMRNVLSL